MTANARPAKKYVRRSTGRSSRKRLLYRVDHVEDGEIHRDDHAADDHAEEYNHDRLEQREQARDGGVDLFVVEVRDLRQHFVETTGGLADGDHRDHHGREHGGLGQRGGDRVTARDRSARRHDRVLNDAVAGGFGRDFQAVENADTGADQRAKRTREARHRRFPEHVAEHREGEHELVDLQLAVRRRVVLFDREASADEASGDDQAAHAGKERGEADHDTGRQRQGETDLAEHALEDRDDEDEQDRDGDKGDRHDDAWVDHRALHLADQVVVLLHEDREAHQDRVENTARLAGRHHVHVQIAEGLRVFPQGVGDRVTGLDVEHDGPRDGLERWVLTLLRENVERLDQRQTGVDHRRELAGEDDDVAHLDPAAARLLLRLGRVVDLDDGEPLALQLGDHILARRGVDGRRLQLAVDRSRRVGERRHSLRSWD